MLRGVPQAGPRLEQEGTPTGGGPVSGCERAADERVLPMVRPILPTEDDRRERSALLPPGLPGSLLDRCPTLGNAGFPGRSAVAGGAERPWNERACCPSRVSGGEQPGRLIRSGDSGYPSSSHRFAMGISAQSRASWKKSAGSETVLVISERGDCSFAAHLPTVTARRNQLRPMGHQRFLQSASRLP
jgi:hypothetical protein